MKATITHVVTKLKSIRDDAYNSIDYELHSKSQILTLFFQSTWQIVAYITVTKSEDGKAITRITFTLGNFIEYYQDNPDLNKEFEWKLYKETTFFGSN